MCLPSYTEFIISFAGGAYDTVPEVCILLALFEHSEKFYPVVFDEAGERDMRGNNAHISYQFII